MIALDHFSIKMSVDEKLLMARTTADSGTDWSMHEVRQISSSSVQPTTDLHELLATSPIELYYNLLGLGITISVTNDPQIQNDTRSLQQPATLTCEVHQVVNEADGHSCCTNGHFQPFHSK